MSFLKSLLCFVLLLIAATFVCDVPAAAQARTGVVVTVEVPLVDVSEVDVLTAAGYNISAVRGLVATIHATPEELALLAESGYTFQRVLEPKTFDSYPTYAELTAALESFADSYPGIARLYTLGQSGRGREVWAMLITDLPDTEEDEPEFKYVSTMHGNEPVGTVLCMNFIEKLLAGYGADPRVTAAVDTTAIWIVPLMNPDGYETGNRFNGSGLDLNRSFPIYPDDFRGTVFDGTPLLDAGRATEAAHVMRWTVDNSFVLSANFHTGSFVVNYPYDDDGGPSGTDAPTPDDLLFEDLSRRYSINNPPMYNNGVAAQGITNGAAWYVIRGGMQDWLYRYAGCLDVTIELSIVSIPPVAELPGLWANNEESMMVYLESVHIGARGIVTDASTGAPVYAKVTVAGNAQPVFTDPDVGDYHRLLLPGTYSLTFSAPGYTSQTVTDVTVAEGPATRVDVALEGGANPLDCPAKAVFEAQPQVLAQLRTLRDQGLMKSEWGRRLVDTYYAAAPYLAERVTASRSARDAFMVAAAPFAQLGAALETSPAK